MLAVHVDAGTICGETVTRSSTALMSAASRGGPADGEAASVIGTDAEAKDGEASASFISLLMSADFCHCPLNDDDTEGSGGILAAELFWEVVLAVPISLVIGTIVCEVDKAVSSNEWDGGGTIFLVTIIEKAVAGRAGRIGGSACIFLRTTSCRAEEPVSDIKRTSTGSRVGSSV